MDNAPLTASLANPRSDRVKAVRALSGRSARLRHGQFLVEGPQSVREVVRYAPELIRDLYLSEAVCGRYVEIVTDARAAGLSVQLATPEVLGVMSPDAQGVLAVAHRTGLDLTVEEALDRASRRCPVRLVAVLANVRDPGNAGAVIRAADAAGADLVALAGQSVATDNPKLVRSTAGSLFHLPVITGGALPIIVDALRAAGLRVLAADGAGDQDLDDLLDIAGQSHADLADHTDLARPTAWLFGNEAWGLTDEDRALADAVVRVPIRGHAESLNLATAAAVCLYASARAQRPPRTVPGDDTP